MTYYSQINNFSIINFIFMEISVYKIGDIQIYNMM